MFSGQRLHFIGIGGYGMSGLAWVLHHRGVHVTGSDARESERTRRLAAAGIPVHIGHDRAHVAGADVVVRSTDVPDDNPELVAAAQAGAQVLHRSEVLAQFINRPGSIAVTGTHGKTTTTAMIGLVLERAGLDPTVFLGADFRLLHGSTARAGSLDHVVAEADESDRSFLRYFPAVAVVTNVEPEHLEFYEGSFANIRAAFAQFIEQMQPGGLRVLCADDAALHTMAAGLDGVAWFGFRPEAEWSAADVVAEAGGMAFSAVRGGQPLGRVRLAVPGRHNVLNALAALAVGDYLAIPFEQMAATLAIYPGASRRFQVVAEAGGITVVDDYAHHPTEIRATLAAARERGGGRVVAVFQPQRYTRTANLMQEFSEAFGDADVLVLTDIYAPPGQNPIPGVSSGRLAQLIEAREGRPVRLLNEKGAIVEFLLDETRPGDTVLVMGAGDIWQVAHELGRRLGGERG